ncbi:MAG TPA: DUF72 domain-containing protein [Pyrinomonadaceae bacterium]|nr:DUF72 domain-containing protein [Pyrinomonadaceae bacterium]
MKFHIGTSGWHYKHWMGGVFYPPGTRGPEMFQFYARHFNTVEINNSFYRLPTAQTFDAWRESSPRGFCFAVKASRFITHMKKLKEPESSSAKFFLAAERLGKKLGPILFQLPPRWKLNVERLASFLELLPPEHKYVFEFRDQSWLVPEVYGLLRKYNAAFCIHDFADMKVPHEITSNFAYIRFHGPTSAKYWGEYSDSQLQAWAERIAGWRVSAVYAYFNNDPGGAAVRNAMTLKTLVSKNTKIEH